MFAALLKYPAVFTVAIASADVYIHKLPFESPPTRVSPLEAKAIS
jgi:hypothetical protein